MPRKRNFAPPSFSLHKASGRAVVRSEGKDHYSGPHGSPESHAEYARSIAERQVARAEHAQQLAAAVGLADFTLTVAQVVHRYREFARTYYARRSPCSKSCSATAGNPPHLDRQRKRLQTRKGQPKATSCEAS